MMAFLGWSLILTGTLQGQLIINEFLASNRRGLIDEDRQRVDWIEIANTSTQPVSTEGWSLTDDPERPKKWILPSRVLRAGEHLVIFASGKNRQPQGGPWHTNFKLAAQGEYLGLYAPHTEEAISDFSPSYPPQFSDISYGFVWREESFSLIDPNTEGRLKVPDNADMDWVQSDFNDGAWTTSLPSMGYDTGTKDEQVAGHALQLKASQPELYWAFEETQGTLAANQGSLGSAAHGLYQGQPRLTQEGPRPPAFPILHDDNLATGFDGRNDAVEGPERLLSGSRAFTMAGWIRPEGTQSSRTGLWGQNDAIEFGFIQQGTLQLWSPAGSLNWAYPHPSGQWHHIAAVGNDRELILYADGQRVASSGHNGDHFGRSNFPFRVGGNGIFDATGNHFKGSIDEVALWKRALSDEEIQKLLEESPAKDYTALIQTDLKDSMYQHQSTVDTRFTFEVSDPNRLHQLDLKLRIDDGFVAWINGTEVATWNAPENMDWKGHATDEHPDQEAMEWRSYSLDASLLHKGWNVLAVRGFNLDAHDPDFLLTLQLDGVSSIDRGSEPMFMRSPSPGEKNHQTPDQSLPLLTDVSHQPTQPMAGDPIHVTARLDASLPQPDSLYLRYRFMFEAEKEIPMRDDGLGGDDTAEDGVWTAIIPTSINSAGWMLRYAVQGVDADGNTMRWPLFPNPRDSAAYLGLVIHDPSIQTKLPVVHLFMENPSMADTDLGTRASLFHDGELYDNIHISVHGQSSRGFPKKSYNLDFNQDHRFAYQSDAKRVKDIRLMTQWGDKSRVRNTLAYEMIQKAGSHGHFCFPVRVQRNGSFFSIADMMEDADDRWLERLGLDPEGALYKMYNNLGGAGGNEKKTRRWENTKDLQDLVNLLSESRPLAQRTRDAWDVLDLPQTVSYFVALALCSSQDHGHKNYYLYRDSEGSGEWAPLPWDVDLSWGRNWVDARGYFHDTLYQDNELDFYNSSQQNKPTNRLYELVKQASPFQSMVLRRLRTVMDQWLQAPGVSSNQGIIEARILALMDRMDPPEIRTSDADLDTQRWGSWGNRLSMRREAQRIIDLHLPGRRRFLFEQSPRLGRGTIPASQPALAAPSFGPLEFNPASGDQTEEYLTLKNDHPFALDLSGWRLSGGVRHAFRPGTVIPAESTLYLTPRVSAFRSRRQSPRGGESLFVQGNYQGQLDARGETLLLTSPDDRVHLEHTFEGQPTPAQLGLRITEIFYHPNPQPPFSDQGEAFEYLELTHAGTSTLELRGIRFTRGIDFAFADDSPLLLRTGQSLVIVRNEDAFRSRFGDSAIIAGVFDGALDNGGESLRLEDAGGERILDFSFSDQWYPTTDGEGFSLTARTLKTPWNAWDEAGAWVASREPGGDPGHFSESDAGGDWALEIALLPSDNHRATLAFHHQANQVYTLETIAKLTDEAWIPLEVWISPQQTGRHAFTVDVGGPPTGFFRIRSEPRP